MNETVALALLEKQLGSPYVWGANGPGKFDCSGLFYWWSNQTGNARGDATAAGLYDAAKALPSGEKPRLGDLAFLSSGGKITHVGILANSSIVVEARGRAYGVVRTPLSVFLSRTGYTGKGVRRIPAFKLDKAIPKPSTDEVTILYAAQESPRFGGDPSVTVRGTALKKIPADLIGLSETTLAIRNGINKALGKEWWRRKHSAGSIATFFDRDVVTNTSKREIGFGDNYHGALVTPVTIGSLCLDVINVHNEPKTVASQTEKNRNIERVMDELIMGWPAIIMGDFSMNADAIMKAHGYTRATLLKDSYDAPGNQPIDAMYYKPSQLTVSLVAAINPGKVSDHIWQLATFGATVPR